MPPRHNLPAQIRESGVDSLLPDRKPYRQQNEWGRKRRNAFDFSIIEQRSIPEPNCGCWLWLGTLTACGYGTVSINGRSWFAHRLSYSTFHNVIINPSLIVRHSCDNPPCVNPGHLKIGSIDDNNQDAVSRGRNSWGIGIWTAKLQPSQVWEIRRMISENKTNKTIAGMFGVHDTTISLIRKNKIWRRA